MAWHSIRKNGLGPLTTLDLENRWLRVRVLPELGAKIYDLIWKPTGKNFLWHNPRIAPHTYPMEADFDNHWCGGWDDAFPTRGECVFREQRYPNLGELRSLLWKIDSVSRRGKDLEALLSAFGPISPVKAIKTITVEGNSPVVRMHYRIINLGPMSIDFIWGTHPALAINEHTLLHIPARHGIVAQCSQPGWGQPGQRYDWPLLEAEAGRAEMDKVRTMDANICFGHYAVDLEEGVYAVEDVSSGEGLLLRFPLQQCPSLWLWLNYGGWRGYHHVILEPWTSISANLAQAYEQKTSLSLKPGEEFATEMKATVYHKPETWKGALGRM